MRNIFLQKSYTKWNGVASPSLFHKKNEKLTYLWINYLKCYKVYVCSMSRLGSTKIYLILGANRLQCKCHWMSKAIQLASNSFSKKYCTSFLFTNNLLLNSYQNYFNSLSRNLDKYVIYVSLNFSNTRICST